MNHLLHLHGSAPPHLCSLDTCSSLCYTHNPSPKPCHFFILHDGDCMLGNYAKSGSPQTMPVPAGQQLTAYYNESELC